MVLEDIAALVGLVLAFLGVSIAVITDNGIYDGIGTVFIGLLLIVVAVDPRGRDEEPADR